MKILVTGAAGFIGSKTMYHLAKRGDEVVGIDNINDYYDDRIKYGRLSECGFSRPFVDGDTFQSTLFPNCRFRKMAIDDKAELDALFEEENDEGIKGWAKAKTREAIPNILINKTTKCWS